MGDAEYLIASIVGAGPDEWSPAAVELARQAIVDTLALAVPGSLSTHARVAAETILPTVAPEGESGPLVASLLTDSRSFAAADAAFVMGTAIHSMDWDDYMHPMHGHCSVVLLSTLLPLAEALDVDGNRLLDAFLVGYQVDWLVSLGLSHAHYRAGWHATSTIGVLGAATAAARLLGLDVETTERALGIAASMAGGIRANFGTTTKALHAGFASRSGIQAVQLASAGASSSPDWLTAPAGMIATFGGEYTAPEAVEQIRDDASMTIDGHPIHGIETAWGRVQKPYSCCGSVHGAVDALLHVLSDSEEGEIDTIVAHVDPIVVDIMRHSRPTTPEQAKYSPSWVIAAAAVDRSAGPRQFDTMALARNEIHEMRQRVTVADDWVTDDNHRFGGRVEVRWRNGREATYEVGEAKGHPRRPMTATEQTEKATLALAAALPQDIARHLTPVVQDVVSAPVRQTIAALRAAIVDPLSVDRDHTENEQASDPDAHETKVGTL